jgi:hypothetical protein
VVFAAITVHDSLDNRMDRVRLSVDTRYQLRSEPIDPRWIGDNPTGHSPAAVRRRICCSGSRFTAIDGGRRSPGSPLLLCTMNLLDRHGTRAGRLRWYRLWVSRENEIRLDGAGFLAEPHPSGLLSINRHLATLDQLDVIPCLLLLGDPRLGKSWEIERYAVELRSRLGQSAPLIAIDLKNCDARDFLRREVFDTAVLADWRDGTDPLHLVLDSFDEAPIKQHLLTDMLLRELERLPLGRVRLRIACRTAVLPPDFRYVLKQRFEAAYPTMLPAAGDAAASRREDRVPARAAREVVAPEGAFAEVEIAMLTRADVRTAALARLGSEADADRFLDRVEAVSAGAFAARPQSLFALLERFARGDLGRVSQVELFREQCLSLTDPLPPVPSALDASPYHTTSGQRYRLAGRLSAAMLFGNRHILWLGQDPPRERSVLDVREVTGRDYVGNADFEVHERALWEAVNTSVFTGADELGMVPLSAFAEFLAADWMAERHMPLTQVRALLTGPADAERRIVPQLRRVAAWLAVSDPDVLELVARTEPDVLVWSDVVQLTPAQRPRLVEGLLAGATANRIENPPYDMWRLLGQLEHPGLAQQLGPVLRNRALPMRTRDLALDIARACSVTAVASDALRIALDDTEALGLRVGGAGVVAVAGSDDEHVRVKSLALAALDADVADELKGEALRACWRLLSPEELFAAITPMRRSNWGGAYARALREIGHGLTRAHVRAGIAWLEGGDRYGIYIERVAGRVLHLALDALDDASVRAGVARYALHRAGEYLPLLADFGDGAEGGVRARLEEDVDLRRRLLAAVVAEAGVGSTVLPMLASWELRLVRAEDVPWALSYIARLPRRDTLRKAWAAAVQPAFDVNDAGHVHATFSHADDPDVMATTGELARSFASPEDVRTAVAARREEWEREVAERRAEREALRRRNPPPPPVSPPGPLHDRLARRLTADARWPGIAIELLRADDGGLPLHFTADTIAALRGLRGSAVAGEVAATAVKYLRSVRVAEEPFPDGRPLWLVLHGFVAAVSVHELAPDQFEKISSRTWAKWTRPLVGYAPMHGETGVYRDVLRTAVAKAPVVARDEVVRLVGLAAQEPNRGTGRYDVVLREAIGVAGCRAALAERLRQAAYGVATTEHLLTLLLQEGCAEGVQVGRELLRGLDDGGEAADLGVAAGAVLLTHALAAAWAELSERLNGDPEIAKKILEHAARAREFVPRETLGTLGDAQVAGLYLVVARLYPPETDLWHAGAYSPSPCDNLQRWREGLLRLLETRQTATAVEQLERIVSRSPERDDLVQVWLSAKAALRGDLWQGTPPRDVTRLAERRDLRVVESGPQLLDLLEESLGRYQDELQGEWRGVVGLWNESGDGNQPKSEEHLANDIARHLRRDLVGRGIVIGRELVLQTRVRGGAPGLRTDIHVTAQPITDGGSAADPIVVVIEVKGSWNTDLLHALRGQLVAQYLDPHRLRFGLYVVGHFTCDSWGGGRRRQQSERHGTREEVIEVLSAQAVGASVGLREVRVAVLNTALPDVPEDRSARVTTALRETGA